MTMIFMTRRDANVHKLVARAVTSLQSMVNLHKVLLNASFDEASDLIFLTSWNRDLIHLYAGTGYLGCQMCPGNSRCLWDYGCSAKPQNFGYTSSVGRNMGGSPRVIYFISALKPIVLVYISHCNCKRLIDSVNQCIKSHEPGVIEVRVKYQVFERLLLVRNITNSTILPLGDLTSCKSRATQQLPSLEPTTTLWSA